MCGVYNKDFTQNFLIMQRLHTETGGDNMPLLLRAGWYFGNRREYLYLYVISFLDKYLKQLNIWSHFLYRAVQLKLNKGIFVAVQSTPQ